jgi:hypothetical protein
MTDEKQWRLADLIFESRAALAVKREAEED